jgi:hypothetical protein
MPYSTQLPDGFITLNADGLPIVDTNTINILNDFGESTEFTNYNVPGEQGLTELSYGDSFNIVNDDGAGTSTSVDSGTYLGSFTLSTASVSADVDLGLLDVAEVTVSLNPIEGELYQDEDGNFFMITDDPLDEDHLGVTIEIEVLGIQIAYLDLSLSEALDSDYLDDTIPLAGDGIGEAVASVVQSVLDSAVVTFEVDTTGTIEFNDTDLVCFTSGTLIKTARGEVPVEKLQLGDQVLTLDAGYQEILWIGARTLSSTQLKMHPKLLPIRIAAGALGVNQPEHELLVSPQHRVLIHSTIAERMFGHSEVLVAAKQLLEVDGIEIADDVTAVTYWHFMFDAHQIVFANGAATESLYTGSEALKAVGREARQEILGIFPELGKEDLYAFKPARVLVSGRRGRRLAKRTALNNKMLVAKPELAVSVQH